MKRAYSGKGTSLMQSFTLNGDVVPPATHFPAAAPFLQPRRPCFPETHNTSGGQLLSADLFGSGSLFSPGTAATSGAFSSSQMPVSFCTSQQLSNTQLSDTQEAAAFPAGPVPFFNPAAHLAASRMMSATQSGLQMQCSTMQNMQHQQQPQPQPQQGALLPQLLPPHVQGGSCSSTVAASNNPAAAPPSSLLARMDAQAAAHQPQPPQDAQQQQKQSALRLADEWRPLNELQRLLPRLNQEYKREMQLLLKACQVAGRVTKSSAPVPPAAGMLLLDPAARDQLQHQVLSNCNDKHAAVTAAFRVAAQAVAAAVSSAAAGSMSNARAAAAAAVEVLHSGTSGSISGSRNFSSLADAAGRAEGSDSEAAPEAVAEALQQLRSSYHQELVAATSALFAICRGFGQTSTMAAASSQPIKNALAAAQQQHVRVERLWQDVLVVAAGGRE